MLFWYVFLQVVISVYKCVNFFATVIVGYSFFSGHKFDRKLMFKEYGRSAHVMRVIFKARPYELEGPQMKHFLLKYVLNLQSVIKCLKNKRI